MTIDSTTGALALTMGSPFATGVNPVSIAIHPTGQYLYVSNLGDNTISVFSIDKTTGVTTQLTKSPFTAGTEPLFTTTDPAGKFLYVCNETPKNVFQYVINPDTGGIPASTVSTSINLAPGQLIFGP
jgi:YVTN family beta-propeller protein